MVMRFEGHVTAWKNGRDVRQQYAQNVERQALMDRRKEHKRGDRSYFANSDVATDDYWWHTRIQYLEKQGQNILKFPKTFENIHGRLAGAAPVLVRPFSPSIASEAGINNGATAIASSRVATPKVFKLEDNALESWGRTARLFNTAVAQDYGNDMAHHMTLATTALNINDADFVDNYEKYDALTKVAAAAASSAITFGLIKGGAKISSRGGSRGRSRCGSRGRSRGGSRGGSRGRSHGNRSSSPELSYMAGITHAPRPEDASSSVGSIGVMPRPTRKESIIKRRERVVDPIHCGGQVLKTHINSYLLGTMRKNRGEVRRSSMTAQESKVWHADEAAEPVWKRVKKIPPVRNPKNVTEASENVAGGASAELLAMFNHKRAVALLADSVEAETEDEAYAPEPALSPSRLTTPLLADPRLRSARTESASPDNVNDKTKSVNFAGVLAVTQSNDAATATPPERPLIPRPSSAPLALGIAKTQYNEYYYESVMMNASRVSWLPRLRSEVDPVNVQPVPVDLGNLKKEVPPIHFGYDADGNLISLVARSHQAIIRPSTASRYPLTLRERQSFVSRARRRGLLKDANNGGQTLDLKESSGPNGTFLDDFAATSAWSEGSADFNLTVSSAASTAAHLANGSGAMNPMPTRRLMRKALGAVSHPWQGSRPSSSASPSRSGSRQGSPGGRSGRSSLLSAAGDRSPSPPSSPASSAMLLGSAFRASATGLSQHSLRGASPGRSKSPGGGAEADYTRRDRINVPMDVVYVPKMIISKTLDINLYNDIDRAGPNPEVRIIEKKALMDLFADTDGPNWINKANWGSNKPLKEWFGISVDTRGFVCEIKLSKNNLSGQFPLSIGQLKELEVLEFDENNLCGPIGDAAINSLEHLEVLSLRKNQLEGDVPYRIFSFLRTLREVWLSCNKLTGHIHEAIGGMTSCTHLCLYDNQITGIIPPQIARLTKLEVLSLGKNQLHGTLPDDMMALARLSHLSLYQNKFSGPVPDWIEDLESLQELNLNFNNFTGYVPRSAYEMKVTYPCP